MTTRETTACVTFNFDFDKNVSAVHDAAYVNVYMFAGWFYISDTVGLLLSSLTAVFQVRKTQRGQVKNVEASFLCQSKKHCNENFDEHE